MALEFSLSLNTDNHYHKDFIVTAKEAGLNIVADAYYFILGNEAGEYNYLKEYLRNYIDDWCDKILQLKEGEYILMPVDLSDQYVGFLKIEFTGNNYTITYGSSAEIEGWGILGEDIFKVYSSANHPIWQIDFEGSFLLSAEEIKESFKLKVTAVN